jgi:hypothetical protein
MNSKLFTPRFILVCSVILIAAAMRLAPHWPNFTPIAAIALFGGAYLGKKYLAFIVPMLAMLVSDLIIGFHGYMIAVYFSFAITVALGILISKNVKFHSVLLASIGSSALFFIITNFAVWAGSPFYSQDISGLMTCYAAALPFFKSTEFGISFLYNGLLGDIFYNTLLFGSFALASIKFPVLARTRA